MHPWLFSAGSIGAGVGAFILAAQMLVWMQVIAGVGLLLICLAFVAAATGGGEEEDGVAGLAMAGGSLFLLGSAGVLIASVIGGLGVMCVASGTGVAIHTASRSVIAWNYRRKLSSEIPADAGLIPVNKRSPTR